VATNDCHYLLPTDHFAHDVLVCIQTGKTVHSHDRIRYSPQHYLKSRAEMSKLFEWAPGAVENTLEVAGRCDFSFEKQPNHLPNFPVPDGFDIPSYFEKIVRDGFDSRMPRWRAENDAGRLRHTIEAYRERLETEIRVVREMGFAGYFLIVWDFIRFSRECGIPVGPGRGSAAGSLVAYCLRITDIDPMQFDLLFERFLNPSASRCPTSTSISVSQSRARHRLRHGEIRPTQRCPDHHLRDDGGTRGHPRRRARPGHSVRRGRQDREARPATAGPGHHDRQALADVPALKQAYETIPASRS
jgi:DNA polymerase-3 subunit alpha